MFLKNDSVLKNSFIIQFCDKLLDQVWCLFNKFQFLTLAVLFLDVSLGYITQQLCGNYGFDLQQLPDIIIYSTEHTVLNLKQILHWLMSNPAGLKLNSVLSTALGNFFLYHIHLWVTYVDLILPAVGKVFTIISPYIQFFPITLQLAILGDVLSMLCIHIFCFYAYARRITQLQYSGCLAYARLFAGKKYNPLRKRIDTADDVSIEHLFLGTILFTILLFLAPTTFTFFTVFWLLRLSSLCALKTISTAISIIQLEWI